MDDKYKIKGIRFNPARLPDGSDIKIDPVAVPNLDQLHVRGPADLPDLRLALIENWKPGAAFSEAMSPVDDHYADWETNHLLVASLWWVTADMCDLVAAVAPKVPDDAKLEEIEWPSPSGFILFEKPWVGLSSTTSEPLEVGALLWGPTIIVAGGPNDNEGVGRGAMSFSTYSAGALLPMGKSDWPLKYPITQTWSHATDQQRASMIEDRRMIVAFMTLIRQRLAATEQAPVIRQAVRRQIRAGINPRVASNIKIVDFRKKDRPAHESTDSEGRKVNWTHRWMVDAYVRHQPYGPGRSLRRLQVIPPFPKGPADKPLIIKKTINVFRH